MFKVFGKKKLVLAACVIVVGASGCRGDWKQTCFDVITQEGGKRYCADNTCSVLGPVYCYTNAGTIKENNLDHECGKDEILKNNDGDLQCVSGT